MAAFTTQLPNVFSQIGGAVVGTGTTGPTGINISSRATITLGNKPFHDRKVPPKGLYAQQRGGRNLKIESPVVASTAAAFDVGAFSSQNTWARNLLTGDFQVAQQRENDRLPAFLQRLTDPEASADFPPAHKVNPRSLDNRELDKLVGVLGKNKATWRRALQLHEWLLGLGHVPDDRLCTTLMRVCSQHGQTMESLNLYEWMRTSKREGGAGLRPTVYTYTAAMRAALVGNLPDRALRVWDDAMKTDCQIDCRMATTLIEVCTRKGHTERALSMYELMRDADPRSKMAPSVHSFTAAMRAATEGNRWERALEIWRDMQAASCAPSGHAYAAAISACAAGGVWEQAVALFEAMMRAGIKPDVVSCTALITAFAADAQWQRAEAVVEWMLSAGVKPNVRTYTALITALGNGREWSRALATIERMRGSELCAASLEPNAYTYSALLKAMGEQGEWQLAQGLFGALEAAALGRGPPSTVTAGDGMLTAERLDLRKLTVADRNSSLSSLGSLEYGAMPTALAEEVLKSSSPKIGDQLPDSIPGQSNLGEEAERGSSPFSFFSGATASPETVAAQTSSSSSNWTSSTAAVNGFPTLQPSHSAKTPEVRGGEEWVADPVLLGRNPRAPLNEVVCGAMMMAYEKAGLWQQALDLLPRSRALGIEPNLIMYNTAISALGKARFWEAAEEIFGHITAPDAVSYETMIAAYGLSGEAEKAERLFQIMLDAGYAPKDYAFCSLVAAYGSRGDWRSALRVRSRMQQLGCPPSIHVYNSLIAVCEQQNQWDQALLLSRTMKADGILPNAVTQRLLESVGKGGISAVEEQQVAAAALAAAVAAAGSIIIRAGII